MPVRPMTMDFLLNAFSGESMAHMRYLIFAEVAEKEKFFNVARLFKAIAHAEFVHARNHYSNLSEYKGDFKTVAGTPAGPGKTSKNLELAIMGEEYEVNEMYPAYLEVARAQGERGAERSFKWALEAEKIHSQLYREAKSYVDRGEDWVLKGKVWICTACGHTYVGEEPPEKCPICGVPKDRYLGF
ncbi:MAG: rubrerythrin family protein [Thermofilaceae archaeon]|nr:rubrerythrin family protein [Thermofilaceae archaeon]MCX8181346.1 rubrerythrin family protein [Thermofilaceae archaeon]MDW8003589.1 rubrerythrin family protein [Thermofilaceae archaeon]